MPGFSLSIGNINSLISQKVTSGLVCDSIKGEGYELNKFTLNKFLNDKIFFEDDNCIIVIEGIVLNKSEIIERYQNYNWEETVWNVYQDVGDEFFKIFNGTFSGLLFNKKTNKWIIYTDQIGSKHLYYYRNNNKIFVSSEIADVYNYLNKNSITCDLDINAAYMLLSYGYMLDDNTLCCDIKKLRPGHYIIINNDSFTQINYYKLPKASAKSSYTESELIDEIDLQFRKAIDVQFQKDGEYGYNHLVALSGGLDSRMTSWVAHEMGYKEQMNFTFSQSDYLDETIPKKITSDLKHDWIFKALDNGLFLKDIDEINKITGGNVLYYGLAHGNSMLKLLNFNTFGIIHTGQLGDVIIGSYIKDISLKNLKHLGKAYSNKLIHKVKSKVEKFEDFADLEIAQMYQRGINGINTGLLAQQVYSETMSPFYNIDFFEFCLSIPIHNRMGHNLYKKWILSKYPNAAKYVWESTKRKIGKKSIFIKFKGKQIALNRLFPLLLYKFNLKKQDTSTRHHMNPLEYWYNTNTEIKSFQDLYYDENIQYLKDHSELKTDCEFLYKTGSAIEKNQVLTLLSAYKLFYLNNS